MDDLRTVFRGGTRAHELLGKYTSFRIGGPAELYIEPVDKDDVVTATLFAGKNGIPLTVMGNGSNLLISDDGIPGIVMNLESGLHGISAHNGVVNAESGIRIGKFVDFCIQQGLAGVEMLAGIPGTIGGAVVMNAGAYGGETSDHLIDVEVLRGETIVKVAKADCGFSYRRSGFQKDIVLSARFALPAGSIAEMLKRRRELLLKRNESQPLNLPNSGSVFKNPAGKYAAQLVDQCGLKGTRIGNAQISEKHGNFIVNLGDASANDVVGLITLERARVKEQFGITLEAEVKLMGFPANIMETVYG